MDFDRKFKRALRLDNTNNLRTIRREIKQRKKEQMRIEADFPEKIIVDTPKKRSRAVIPNAPALDKIESTFPLALTTSLDKKRKSTIPQNDGAYEAGGFDKF